MDGGPRVPEQRRPGSGTEESAALRFSVLGPVRAWRGPDALPTGSPQQRALLAALLLREGRTATSGELIDALWGDDPPSQALAAVRTYASRLRKVLDSRRPGQRVGRLCRTGAARARVGRGRGAGPGDRGGEGEVGG